MDCPFCQIDSKRLVWSGTYAVAIRDGFPVSPGHTLVIPRRHVATWFDATPEEQAEIWQAVAAVKAALDENLRPDGYNIGINSGSAAGQTVMHLHVHVIPRFSGDVDEPAGGVRFVIPAYGNYRSPGRLPRPVGAQPEWLADSGSEKRLTIGGQDPFERQVRPALRSASRVDIVAAFVQGSGVDLLDSAITSALERGTHFRVITGDYLHITQSQALRRLLDWSQIAESTDADEHGTFEVRVVETRRLGNRSFHPKSWRFEADTWGSAWVGSSNWSRMALTHAVEWNLRVDRASDPQAYQDIVEAFRELWSFARPLTSEWLIKYASEATTRNHPLLPGESDDIQPAGQYEPVGVQPEALAALKQSREQGRRRALVVLATGLGKTFLSAFDVRAMSEDLGRSLRVLFLAHRRELLVQASKTFRKVFPDASIGLFVGKAGDLDSDMVFASVQKLALDAHLSSIRPDQFDYVIVDESHHAPAATYRRILSTLTPQFLLGLTATPERADQGDVAGLFDDHIAFQADLGEGIALKRLVPFDYAGLPDTIEFEAIPWRRYTVEQLSKLAETEARMERLLSAWHAHPGTRTIVFCVSIRHADYVASWLGNHGIRIVACHTGEQSADRETALKQLVDGELDAVAAVDLFNEGVDVPLVDRVVMLRPTSSSVVFLQQLGRGLRIAEGKERLQVIDFIGNHRAFLHKIRTLLSLAPGNRSIGNFLREETGELQLREGCRVNVDLEVIDMLRKFLPSGSKNEVVRVYREIRDSREADTRDVHDARPAPGELVRMGLNPRSLSHESWFAFVQDEGDLSAAERAAFTAGAGWLKHLETCSMNRSFKMVLIEVMLESDGLLTPISLKQLAHRSHALLERDPTLRSDVEDKKEFAAGPDSSQWLSYWKKHLISVWKGSKWFQIVDEQLVFNAPPLAEEAQGAFMGLTRELVDMRLAIYRRRRQTSVDEASSFECKVISNKRYPILKLPDRNRDRLPVGETDIRTDDGRVWLFRFVAIACNVAKPVGSSKNHLPDLLYRWFGPSAGKPGTDFRVRFSRSPEGWWVEPQGTVIELPARGELVSFPTLRAAAGAYGEPASQIQSGTVQLPHSGEGRFAVRASGDSMDGGPTPVHDGDWIVMEWARGRSLDEVNDRICLVAKGPAGEDCTHHLKRVLVQNGRALLHSDNPLAPGLEADGETVVLARMVAIIPPEQLAPSPGTVVPSIRDCFGLTSEPTVGASRVDGHLFILVQEKGILTTPGRLQCPVGDLNPSETAFVFTITDAGWRFAGTARQDQDEWVFPEVDFSTWRALGKGRGASRALDELYIRAAHKLVAHLEQQSPGDWMEGRARRCRFQGRSSRGGVRIDHESMKERTISLTDFAWVLAAFNRRHENGGLLDEASVNYLRYLEGTPKASTRWIDTGWAIVVLEHAMNSGFTPDFL